MLVNVSPRGTNSSVEIVCISASSAGTPDNVCGSLHQLRGKRFVERLRSKFCFCFNDSIPEGECERPTDDAQRNVYVCCSGWPSPCYDPKIINSNLVSKKPIRSSPASLTAATEHREQKCNTLPTVHRGCRTVGRHATVLDSGRKRWGMTTTLPRVRSVLVDITGSPSRAMQAHTAHTSSCVTRHKVSRAKTVAPDNLSNSSSRTTPEVSQISFDEDRSLTVDKEPKKWRLSDDSSHLSNGEIPTYDDEVCESYETTCSEPCQPGHSLPPFYDQVCIPYITLHAVNPITRIIQYSIRFKGAHNYSHLIWMRIVTWCAVSIVTPV